MVITTERRAELAGEIRSMGWPALPDGIPRRIFDHIINARHIMLGQVESRVDGSPVDNGSPRGATRDPNSAIERLLRYEEI